MKNENKPAFAFVNQEGNSIEDREVHYGLTKREYFAAKAMQGMCANIKPKSPDELLEVPENIAEWSVSFADELLKQLEK